MISQLIDLLFVVLALVILISGAIFLNTIFQIFKRKDWPK